MNQMKTRLQALGLLDRAFRATPDDDLRVAVDALGDDHREALEHVVGATGDELTPDAIRAAVAKGRIDGGMESIAAVLTDASLSDCIDKLGEHSDNPTRQQLLDVLPGIVERHGVAITRVMLAATVAGEAVAASKIRDLLKNEELVKLPPDEPRRIVPAAAPDADENPEDPDRAALKAKRAEARRRKREEAAARREQSRRARGR